MSTHTTARLTRAGYGILTTEDGEPIFTALGPNAAANESRLIAIWNNHDQLIAESVTLREDLNVARSNWEAAAEELRLVDPVREQLVAVLRYARRMMKPDSDFAFVDAALLAAPRTAADWPHEAQPDGAVTPVDPSDMGISPTSVNAGGLQSEPHSFSIGDNVEIPDDQFFGYGKTAEIVSFLERGAMVMFPNGGHKMYFFDDLKLTNSPTAVGAADLSTPDDDLFEEMVEAGYTALAEDSDAWRGDPEASPASGRESFAVALRAALAAGAAP